MTKLVGFQAKSGEFSVETGEVRPWSNRYLRCETDENLEDGEFGLKVVEQKLKTVQVCRSLGISVKSTEDEVNVALCRILNSEIEMTVGIVGKEYVIVGFRVVNPYSKKN